MPTPYVAPVTPPTFTAADLYGAGAGGRPTTAQIGNVGEVAASASLAAGWTRWDQPGIWLLLLAALAFVLGSKR